MGKVLLIVFQENDTGFTQWINMGYLKATLSQIEGIDTRINFYKLNEIDRAIADAINWEPSIIGLSVLQFNYLAAINFSEKIKEKLPKVHITMGNNFASTYASYLLEKNSFIDSIVIGEGEFTLVELCTCVLNGKPLNGCKGIYYKHETGICKTDKRELHDNLDVYPFPARDFYTNKQPFMAS